MKVLMTGCTPKQCKRQKTMSYFSFFESFYLCLIAGGHEVTWRPVVAGEDLSEFDAAICGLHIVSSNPSRRFRYGPFWAASQLPHLPVLQDWRVKKTLTSVRSQKQLWACDYLGQNDIDNWWKPAQAHMKQIERVRYVWEHHFDKLIVPVMGWGEPEDIRKAHRVNDIYPWDPDAWYDCDAVYGQRQTWPARERIWICAALTDVNEWLDQQGFTWPEERIMDLVENRRIGGFRVGSWKATPEVEVVRERYEKSWGVAIPYYGSACGVRGWWRGRYKLAAWAGCVAWTDPRECKLISHNIPIETIEHMSEQELIELAQDQAIEHNTHATKPATSAAQLTHYLENACEPIS